MKEIFTFEDGLVYENKNWPYCSGTDRRFYTEQVNGFLPGEPQLSNKNPCSGVINLENGFYYDQETKSIYNYDGEKERDVTAEEKVLLDKQTFKVSPLVVYQ
jgi:hypothetical protein